VSVRNLFGRRAVNTDLLGGLNLEQVRKPVEQDFRDVVGLDRGLGVLSPLQVHASVWDIPNRARVSPEAVHDTSLDAFEETLRFGEAVLGRHEDSKPSQLFEGCFPNLLLAALKSLPMSPSIAPAMPNLRPNSPFRH